MKKSLYLLLAVPLLLTGCNDTSYTNEDMESNYQNGYEEGFAAGYEEGYNDCSLHHENCFNPDSITEEEAQIMEQDFEEYVQEYIEENY